MEFSCEVRLVFHRRELRAQWETSSVPKAKILLCRDNQLKLMVWAMLVNPLLFIMFSTFSRLSIQYLRPSLTTT